MQYLKVEPSRKEFQEISEKINRYLTSFREIEPRFELPSVRVLEIFESANKTFSAKQELVISFPVCNHENIINSSLLSLFANVSKPCVLILTLDGCRDRSKEIILQFLSGNQNTEFIVSVVVIESDGDLFETTCENIALNLTETKYFLSMQADIFFVDNSFLSRAIAFLEKYEKLIGISGRATIPDKESMRRYRIGTLSRIHAPINKFLSIIFGKVILPFYFSPNRYFGDLSIAPRNYMRFSAKQLRQLYVGDLIIRGPILWKAQEIKSIGGLDDKRFFLGGDEMDLCRRAQREVGNFTGYLPSTSFSQFGNGTTHKPELRHPDTVHEMSKRRQLQIESDLHLEANKNYIKEFYKSASAFRGQILRLADEDLRNV